MSGRSRDLADRCALIAAQRPHATGVGGYRKVAGAGPAGAEGERTIKILGHFAKVITKTDLPPGRR